MSSALDAIFGTGGGNDKPFGGKGHSMPPKKPKKGRGRKPRKEMRQSNNDNPFADHPLMGGRNWSWMNNDDERREVFPTRLRDVRPPTGRDIERNVEKGVEAGRNLYRGGKNAYNAGKLGYKNAKRGVGAIKSRINKARGKDEGYKVVHSEAKGRMEFVEPYREYGHAQEASDEYEKEGKRSRVEE